MGDEFSVTQLSDYYMVVWSDLYADDCCRAMKVYSLRKKDVIRKMCGDKKN